MIRNYSKLNICLIIVLICALSKHVPLIYLAWLNMTFFILIFFMIFAIFFESQFLKSVWSKLELVKLHPIRYDFLKVTSQFSLMEQLLNIAAAKLHLSSTTFIEPANLQLINIALSMLHLLNETLCLNEILVKLKLSNFLFSKIISFFVSLFCLTKSLMSSCTPNSFPHTSSVLSITNERIFFKPSNW